MAILEQINQMKQQGFSDEQIVQNLKDQGISPREINEALDQSEIKKAVYPSSFRNSGMENMEPSVMQPPTDMNMPYPIPEQIRATTSAKTQEIQAMPPEAEQAYPGADAGYEQYPQNYSPYPEQYAGSSQYPQQLQYQYPAATDTETVTDIASQIVDEKLEKINKQIQSLEKLKTETKGRILDIDARLTRIEKTIDLLQTSILGKIGEYWKNISDLKDEMQATQESFSKILNPLADEMEKVRKIAGTTEKSQETKGMTKTEKNRGRPRAKTNREDGFAHYLRG